MIVLYFSKVKHIKKHAVRLSDRLETNQSVFAKRTIVWKLEKQETCIAKQATAM